MNSIRDYADNNIYTSIRINPSRSWFPSKTLGGRAHYDGGDTILGVSLHHCNDIQNDFSTYRTLNIRNKKTIRSIYSLKCGNSIRLYLNRIRYEE